MNKAENNKKLFSSGGVFVDVFIGFLIAACIAGIVFRCFIYDANARAEQEGQSYMVYFEIIDAHESYAKYLTSSSAVYDAESGMRIGVLGVHGDHAEGSAVSLFKDEQAENADLRMKGVINSEVGVLEQGTLVIGGAYMLTPGQELEVYTNTVSVKVRILKITEHFEEGTEQG